MEESDIINPVWRNLLLKKVAVSLNFLPAKILLSRWHLTLSNNELQGNIEEGIKDLFQMYFKNKELPNAKKDIFLLLKK